MMEHVFGNVPAQVALGNLMRLLPVKAHTLLETLPSSPLAGVKKKKTREYEDGFSVFRSMCKSDVIFTDTHRFLDKDLPALLDIMRTPDGKRGPLALRKAVLARIQAGGPTTPG